MCDSRWILAGLLLISVTSLVAWDKTDLDHFLVTGECNGCDLEGVDLRNAQLKGAKLRWAKMKGSDLQGTDLQRADLTGADLQQSNMTGTHLDGAIILESAVEHGFEGNPGVSSKASFAVNGYSLNKNDNTAGCVGIFLKFV
ncbi:MAG: pentapeptide repeat-containing protein [Candidatus Thiodiazotropha sp. (ex Lucinoma kastoroae)]|nr:pentapeptide repeat-containing protein [Candidatus Thiodiazotropha sp. (ex Lucinoma kastoroae)]